MKFKGKSEITAQLINCSDDEKHEYILIHEQFNEKTRNENIRHIVQVMFFNSYENAKDYEQSIMDGANNTNGYPVDQSICRTSLFKYISSSESEAYKINNVK